MPEAFGLIFFFYFVLYNFILFLLFYFQFLLEYSWLTMLYLCTAKRISYSYTYIYYFLRFFSHIGYHRVWVEFSMLYSRSLWLFLYSSVYVSLFYFLFCLFIYFIFLKLLFYFGVELTNNVVSVAGIYQSGCYTHTYMYSFPNLFPFRLLENI